MFTDVSEALPTRLQDEDGAQFVEFLTQEKHISMTSEKLELTGTENERSKRNISELEDCDEDLLLSYLNNIQEINPDSVLNPATKKNINHLCQ
jgi:hypothetical protein